MSNEEPIGSYSKQKPKSALIWYGIAAVFILSFSLLPTFEYNDPWNNAVKLIDSANHVGNAELKVSMIQTGGSELLKQLKLHPYHPKLHLLAGYYYFQSGKMDSVIYHQIKAIEIGPGSKSKSLENQAKELLANATVNEGLKLISNGDTNAAFKLYASTINKTPDNPLINKNIAMLYLGQDKFDAALFHFYSAQKLNKNDIEIMMGLAKCYLHRANIDSTAFYAKAVLEKSPTNIEAQNLLNLVKR
jgi:tetratricopeptide (TPR) repeat protein